MKSYVYEKIHAVVTRWSDLFITSMMNAETTEDY